MPMRIEYTDDALDDLEAIADYLKRTASDEVADRMIARITATLISRASAGWGRAALFNVQHNVYVTPVLGTIYQIVYQLVGDVMEVTAVQLPPRDPRGC
ncbi:MAG: type II toxin-antitoxin system RelE/ParE family toxin [Proteobacteria bacterium]|nr:type II toxin-antitoxin system RelE/ParE family toxin [Pseudomonadota bacterium]